MDTKSKKMPNPHTHTQILEVNFCGENWSPSPKKGPFSLLDLFKVGWEKIEHIPPQNGGE